MYRSHTAVRNHGLDVYFEKIIYAQELGEDKRSPAVFRRAAELLGVKPRECVFFDDSLAACKGAKAAGMTVVGVRDGCFHGAEADMRELCDRYIADLSPAGRSCRPFRISSPPSRASTTPWTPWR